jgi:hypothetical protein
MKRMADEVKENAKRVKKAAAAAKQGRDGQGTRGMKVYLG